MPDRTEPASIPDGNRERITVEYTGRVASPGFADGPVFCIDPATRRSNNGTLDPDTEATRLADAIGQAIAQVARLIEPGDEETGAILEFQLAMLEDEALTETAGEMIAGGAGAAEAWERGLGEQIAGYEAAEDDYFRARAADLADLRDRVLRNLSGDSQQTAPPGAILIGRDITPTRFLETDWSHGGGIALSGGSPSSHAAMLARSRSVPMVTGLGFDGAAVHGRGLLDAERGSLILSPHESQAELFNEAATHAKAVRQRAERYRDRPAATRDGVPIQVLVNIADPDEVDAVDIGSCDGVGLMRTEFLFRREGGLPDEETQYGAYRKVLEWAGGKPVVIRTMDAGGDKPVPGLTIDECNPFLGLRGIRLSLARPDVFRVQLRALARAGTHGNLKIMLPMISFPEELDRAVGLLDDCILDLTREGADCAKPPVGIMVEVPSVAICPERFSRAAFLSIGSNDLTQYVMAASRESEAVQQLHDVGQPAVLSLIANVCRVGREAGMDVSLCGDAAGDPDHINDLLQRGLRSLSVAPALIGRTKMAVSEAVLNVENE